MTVDGYGDHQYGNVARRDADDHVHAHRRARSKRRAVTPGLIIVGVDDSAEVRGRREVRSEKPNYVRMTCCCCTRMRCRCCRRLAGQPPSLGASGATRRTGQGRSDVGGTTADASRPAHRDRQPGVLAAAAVKITRPDMINRMSGCCTPGRRRGLWPSTDVSEPKASCI
jgi:hypothetical protein